MSKKNNLATRKRQHDFDKRREEAAAKKKADNAIKKTKGDTKMSTASGKVKKKGIRLKKNVVVKGIKIKDSSSKRKVKKLLMAEAAMAMQE